MSISLTGQSSDLWSWRKPRSLTCRRGAWETAGRPVDGGSARDLRVADGSTGPAPSSPACCHRPQSRCTRSRSVRRFDKTGEEKFGRQATRRRQRCESCWKARHSLPGQPGAAVRHESRRDHAICTTSQPGLERLGRAAEQPDRGAGEQLCGRLTRSAAGTRKVAPPISTSPVLGWA
jgi:hypothetical protein